MKKIYQPSYLYLNNAFHKNCAVVTEGDHILDAGDATQLAKTHPDAHPENWDGLVLVPGSINLHNHCFQSMLRGLSCDRPFLEWRDNALYRFSNRFTAQDIYHSAVFAFSEMMKCGVTTVCDFFYLHNYGTDSDEMIVKAAKDVGIRLVLARTMYDWDGAPKGYVETIPQAVENTRMLAQKYNRTDGMTTIIPAPHSLHAASPEMVQAGYELAKELNTGFHIHVAEEPFEVTQVKEMSGGLTPVEFLDKLGVVDERMTIIHGVWLKPSEISLLGHRHASLAYCPSSNMFLADGITDIPAMRKAGVKIGLGSDGACSNNRISVFEEMRMVSLLQKANTCDAMCINYQDAFEMGTVNGASILGLPVGTIESGQKADFVGINIHDLSMQPLSASGEQLLPNIIYSMQPSAIQKVVVNNHTTVDHGCLQTIPETDILSGIKSVLVSVDAY